MATSLREPVELASAPGGRRRALAWSANLLVVASWVSAALFGLYILLFFGGTGLQGAAARWNESLPALYDAATPAATASMALHFVTGGALLLLGPVQLFGAIRRRVPALHRWLGRLYVLCAGLAGLGGLGFIMAKGTVGGPVMSSGFGLYGGLMVLAAAMAYGRARAGRFASHRAWAIRLFALTIGSWLYRMEYAFWFLVMGRVGHHSDFSGWFDGIMAFFFYVPNLAVAELFIRARGAGPGSRLSQFAPPLLLAASAFVIAATWLFTVDYWGPGMARGLTGAPL